MSDNHKAQKYDDIPASDSMQVHFVRAAARRAGYFLFFRILPASDGGPSPKFRAFLLRLVTARPNWAESLSELGLGESYLEEVEVARDTAGDEGLQGLAKLILGRLLKSTDIDQGAGRLHDSPVILDASFPERDEVSPAGQVQAIANLAFTASGLRQAGIAEATVDSFPEVFRQGMAARAAQLGDAGISSSVVWDGALGARHIHGLLVHSHEDSSTDPEKRKEIRQQVQLFNAGDPQSRKINELFKCLGLEFLHIEFGEDTYTVVEREGKKEIRYFDPRREHFGFVDGIGQPFKNLLLEDPEKGGGTWSQDEEKWIPVAKGEIFLHYRDADRLRHEQPAHPTLREGGTYIVFRKLRQDVLGFRAFLRATYGSSTDRQNLLGAQMVGRWPNGSPLVQHPDQPGQNPQPKDWNNFLYENNDGIKGPGDPEGLKCPIGSHIRRTNPRDTGHREVPKRHRILRRGIPYGGAMLDPDATEQDEERGLLFIAFNARLDVQFEVIQRDWINAGEIISQSGARRCPISGANGYKQSSFLERGAPVAIGGLPAFVTNRGGDYFFLPGRKAIRALALGEDFKCDAYPYGSLNASITPTPALLSTERLRRYATVNLLGGKPPAVEVTHNNSRVPMIFLARHADVTNLLKDGEHFSTTHYGDAVRRISGGWLLIGRPADDSGRLERLNILNDGLADLDWWKNQDQVWQFARYAAEQILANKIDIGAIDIVQEYGYLVTFLVATQYLGLRGPDDLTPLFKIVYLRRSPVAGDPRHGIPEGWEDFVPDVEGVMRPYVSMQLWFRLAIAAIFGNIERNRDFETYAKAAVTRLMDYLDGEIAKERNEPSGGATLFAELVRKYPQPQYEEHIKFIIAELFSTMMMVIGAAFSKIVDEVFRRGVDLAAELDGLQPHEVENYAEESLRLNPPIPLLFRVCDRDQRLGGVCFKAGDLACANIAAAGMDPRVFRDPEQHDFRRRDPGEYLNFGPPGSPHECWGKYLARPILREMLLALAEKLPYLRRAAGPAGELVEAAGLANRMVARYKPAAGFPVVGGEQRMLDGLPQFFIISL